MKSTAQRHVVNPAPKRPTGPKTPIQRAVHVQVFATGDTSPSLAGMMHGIDFGDGATTHRLEGYLTDSRGVERRFLAQLDGVQFVTVETRGAPKKTGRDVALHLAYLLFLGRAKRNARGSMVRAESMARESVMRLWAERCYRGVSEETHLNTLKRRGRRVTCGLSFLRFEADDGDVGSTVIALPESAFVLEQQRISLNGKGWLWQHGMETAVYGTLSLVIPVVRE